MPLLGFVLGAVVSVHASVGVGVDLQALGRRRPRLHPRPPGRHVLETRQLKRLRRLVEHVQTPKLFWCGAVEFGSIRFGSALGLFVGFGFGLLLCWFGFSRQQPTRS